MGSSFDRSKAAKQNKTGERFIQIPFTVLRSNEYRSLSHTARSLLNDLVSLQNGKNNGALVLCQKALQPLGWASNDTVNRATFELVSSGVIIKTRQGCKPNRASWFALGWKDLEVVKNLDIDPKQYRRVIYTPFNAKAPKQANLVKCKEGLSQEVKVRPPPHGVGNNNIAPSHGVETTPPTPCDGANSALNTQPTTPPHGEYVDKPYPVVKHASYRLVDKLDNTLTNTLAATPRMCAYRLKHHPKKWRDRWCELNRPIVIAHTAKPTDGMNELDSFKESTTREREDSIPATQWHGGKGIFITAPDMQSHKKRYEGMVRTAIEAIANKH